MLALRSLVAAVERTRLFFSPFDASRYAAAATVAVFVGLRAGYGSVTNLGAVFLLDGVRATEPAVGILASSVDRFVVGAVAVTLATFVSAVSEYVFVDLLAKGDTRLRRYAGDRIGDGARLFVFRSVATAFFLAGAAVVALLLVDISGNPRTVLLVTAAIVAVTVSVVNGFTTDFVVPVVVVRDCSLLRGWRVVSRLVRMRPRAFAAYAVTRILINVSVAVGAAVATALVAALYALPIAASSYALGLTAGGLDAAVTSAAGAALLLVVAFVYVALVVASIAAVVQLPVRLFLRAWSLYFLGAVDDEYALLDEDKPLRT